MQFPLEMSVKTSSFEVSPSAASCECKLNKGSGSPLRLVWPHDRMQCKLVSMYTVTNNTVSFDGTFKDFFFSDDSLRAMIIASYGCSKTFS